MKKKSIRTIAIVGVIIIAIAAIVLSAMTYARNAAPWEIKSGSDSTNPAGGLNAALTPSSNGETQTATLTLNSNYDYVMDPPVLKRGVPVLLQVDLTKVVGCAQDIVIPAFNVRKYVSTSDDTITFTPSKTGTFRIQCSMNMYHGTFQVANDPADAGSVQAAASTPEPPASKSISGGGCSMGKGAGGCGCGMMRQV
jgi:uncharacterized protein